MQRVVRALDPAVVEIVEEANLSYPGRRASGIDVTSAAGEHEERGEHEKGPTHASIFTNPADRLVERPPENIYNRCE
jgi:hypothetical protein